MPFRQKVKSVAHLFALLLVTPALCSYYIRRPILGADRALIGSSQAFALIPGMIGQYLRAAFFRRVLAQCARSATIEFGTIFSQVGARVGENVYIGPMCHIGLVHIEDDVLVASAVHIPSGPNTHGIANLDRPIRDQPGTLRTVRIGAGSWIGSASVVLADVGRGSVIAAGAVVTREIPAFVIAAGVPAEIIRQRTQAESCESFS